MTTKCFIYSCQPASTEDFHRFVEQRNKGTAYQRVLVDIENRLRKVLRAHWSAPMREIPLEERDAWMAGPGKALISAWTKSDDYKAWQKTVKDAAYEAVRHARKEASESGLHWGTYLLIEDAVEMAKRTTKGFNELAYRRNSRIGVQIQIQRPIRAEELVGGKDTRLRVGAERYAVPNMPGRYQYPPKAEGVVLNRAGRVRPPRYQPAALRIGTQEDKSAPRGEAPIWCHFHVRWRRELPAGQVKSAFVQCWTVGAGMPKFELGIIVNCDPVAVPAHPRPTEAVAIDLGWRRTAAGTRIAYWLGTDGAEGELVIADDVSQRQGKSASLHSIRQLRANAFRELLAIAKDELASIWPALAEDLAHCHLWLKTGRFVTLERTWALMSPRPESHPVYEALVAFLKQDRHLWNWEAHNLIRMKNQIEGRAIQFAHDLAKRYGTVIVEDIDLEALRQVDDPARINSRQISKFGPGVVLEAARAACIKHGAERVVVAAAYTTADCPGCGVRNERTPEAAAKLEVQCQACGLTEDQDRIAVRNLLATWRAEREAPASTKPKRAVRAMRSNRKRKEPAPPPTP